MLVGIVIIAEYAAILAGRIDPLVFYLTSIVLLFVFRSYYVIVLGAALGLMLDLFHALPGMYFVIYPLMLTVSYEVLRRIITHRTFVSYLVMYVSSSLCYISIETLIYWTANMTVGSPFTIDLVSLVMRKLVVVLFWLLPCLALYALLRKLSEIRYGYGIESSPPTLRQNI